jgi:hypothetical protein
MPLLCDAKREGILKIPGVGRPINLKSSVYDLRRAEYTKEVTLQKMRSFLC